MAATRTTDIPVGHEVSIKAYHRTCNRLSQHLFNNLSSISRTEKPVITEINSVEKKTAIAVAPEDDGYQSEEESISKSSSWLTLSRMTQLLSDCSRVLQSANSIDAETEEESIVKSSLSAETPSVKLSSFFRFVIL
jgi:hypothetical protein